MVGFGDCIISSVSPERAAGVPGRYFQGHAVKPLIAIIIGPRALRKIQVTRTWLLRIVSSTSTGGFQERAASSSPNSGRRFLPSIGADESANDLGLLAVIESDRNLFQKPSIMFTSAPKLDDPRPELLNRLEQCHNALELCRSPKQEAFKCKICHSGLMRFHSSAQGIDTATAGLEHTSHRTRYYLASVRHPGVGRFK
jgi:hypothetical protein